MALRYGNTQYVEQLNTQAFVWFGLLHFVLIRIQDFIAGMGDNFKVNSISVKLTVYSAIIAAMA